MPTPHRPTEIVPAHAAAASAPPTATPPTPSFSIPASLSSHPLVNKSSRRRFAGLTALLALPVLLTGGSPALCLLSVVAAAVAYGASKLVSVLRPCGMRGKERQIQSKSCCGAHALSPPFRLLSLTSIPTLILPHAARAAACSRVRIRSLVPPPPPFSSPPLPQGYARNAAGVSARAMGGAIFLGAATVASPVLRALSGRPRAPDAEEAGMRLLGGGSLPLGLAATFALLLLLPAAPSALLHAYLSAAIRASGEEAGLAGAGNVAERRAQRAKRRPHGD